MNRITKFVIAAGVIAPALIASSVFAATFSNVQFQNGDVTISGTGGSTVNATFHLIVPAGQVVEFIQTDVIGDNLAPVDTSVGGDLGLQEGTHDVSVSVKMPPNTGTYTLNVQGAGIYGGVRSISGNDNVVGTASFGGALRVVADSSDTSSTSVGSDGTPSWMPSFLAAILAALKPATTPAPVVSSACTAYAQANAGTMQGAKNDANVRLQGFLLSQGASIPALAAGASFGFMGPQTMAAVSWFNSINHCQ